MANSQLFQLTGRTLAISDLVPTQDAAGAADLGKNTWEQVRDLLVGKEYAGVLSQSGTSAPTVAVVKNTIGSASLSRVDVGFYRLTITGGFPETKTLIVCNNQEVKAISKNISFERTSDDIISISVRNGIGDFVDLDYPNVISVYIKVFA